MSVSVSVIIPTYNRSDVLKKTIDSIINQSYKDKEIIIVSNGSTDDTESIVKKIKFQKLIYIYQTGTGSPAGPRNTGILAAKGRFIAFCDDDDLWVENKLEKQINFLEKNIDYDICYTRMRRFDEKSTWVNPGESSQKEISSKELLFKNTIPLSSVVVRKEILEKYGIFDESKEIFGSEDYELMLRLSKYTKLHCINEELLLYYSGKNRFSNPSENFKIINELKYIKRLCSVYFLLIKKRIFNFSEIFIPILHNFYKSTKVIVYNIFQSIKSKLKTMESQ